jgi:phosphoribosylamine--glycine ligase
MLAGRGGQLPTRPGFCVAVVVTTPPFPYSRHQVAAPIGLPIVFTDMTAADDRANLHFGEVGSGPHGLVTSGLYGWTLVVTGTGDSIREAQAAAYRRVGKTVIPNARYRSDIGDRLEAGQYEAIERLGFFG